jgi:opacity protein-like surface antigen
MKKITLLVLSIVALASAASAQTVNQADFTSNPDKFKGMSITIDGVNLHPNTTVPSVAVGGPAVVSVGAGSSPSGNNLVAKCNAPRSYKAIDIDFPTNPTFTKCFYMLESVYNSLPHAQDVIKAQITFKGEQNLGYIITLFKL